MECALQRRKCEEIGVEDAPQFGINEEVFSLLMKDEVVKIDDVSGEMQVDRTGQLSENIPVDLEGEWQTKLML